MNYDEIKRRQHNGEIYLCNDQKLIDYQLECLERLYDFNMTRPKEQEKRRRMLKEMFNEIGEDCYIEPPFHSNFGGSNVHMGSHIYANFNLSLIDDTDIYIGDYCMIGPNVVICTATHPISKRLRIMQVEYNKPVRIGNNVWIGGNSFIMPGVTIGDNSIIGAGSVVTKDIPEGVIAVGSPCRVLREINENDEIYYDKDKLIDL